MSTELLIQYGLIPIVQIVVVMIVVLTVVAYGVYAERKILAFIHSRLGPMRVGPWGLFQPIADGLKLIMKEDLGRGQPHLRHLSRHFDDGVTGGDEHDAVR